MTTAAVYCRISDDRAGQGLGVKRQEADARAWCEARGWEVGGVYVDNDVSAYSGRRRPSYERLLEDVEAGRVGAVVAWHPDRLHRSPLELERFIQVIEATKAKIGTVKAGEYDLATPTGRMSARIVGAVARGESEHKSDRIRRKHEELAAAGQGRGGGTRPFGFNADRLTICQAEADRVREAASRVLAGETIRSICAGWNNMGVATVTGSKWTQPTLKNMLLSGRIAGLREHHGVITAKAVWPGIIAEDEHYRLRAILTDPARRTNGGRLPRSYLLSGGIARCGLCGANLVARPRADKRRCYVCATGPGFSGCGKIRSLAEPLEDLIVEAAMVRLDAPELAQAVAGPADAEEESVADAITADEAKLVELGDLWDAGEITRAEWMRLRSKVEARLQATQRVLSRPRPAAVLHGLTGSAGVLRASWPELSFDRRRAILTAVVERVVLNPALKGRNRFDPDRVDVNWKV